MNFALVLFILVIVSGIAWVADKLYFAPQRRLAGNDRMPLWLEYTAGFFPVICAVFVYYIKRVVALPGDEITYENKRLTINGQPLQYSGGEPYLDPENMRYAKRFTETFPADLGGNRHDILNDPDRPATVFPTERFPGSEFCQYQQSGLTCKVPPGHYFAMGDNRDNSADSRYWGFVPDKNIVGKAFFVWLNLGNLGRIGGFE